MLLINLSSDRPHSTACRDPVTGRVVHVPAPGTDKRVKTPSLCSYISLAGAAGQQCGPAVVREWQAGADDAQGGPTAAGG